MKLIRTSTLNRCFQRHVVTLGATFTFTFTVGVAGVLAQTSALGWTAAPASGVEMRLADDRGALRVDFDFHGGGGWAAFRKEMRLRLPENYEFSFRLKGDAPVNTLEFKLVDPSGDNVWWVRRPDFVFSGDWRTITFRKRHISFAWGPKGGGEITDVAAVEFAITAGAGGKGTVWIDRLEMTPRPPTRVVTEPPGIMRSAHAYTLDLHAPQEYGGVVVSWKTPGRNRSYYVETSADGRTWHAVRNVRSGRRVKDYLQLPETESRYLRIAAIANDSVRGIADVRIMPLAFGENRNRLFEEIAKDSNSDRYPKYFGNVQTYWTVVGNARSDREALINTSGAVEVGRRMFSLEPFLFVDSALVGWGAAQSVSLEQGYLPIPSVVWQRDDLQLTTTTWTDADALWLRYRVANGGGRTRNATLYIAVRPFQVNPTAQFLNAPGGVSGIRHLDWSGSRVQVDSTAVIAISPPAGFGAAVYDRADITDYLVRDTLPRAQSVTDSTEQLASGALAYRLTLTTRAAHDIYLAVPLHAGVEKFDPIPSFNAAVRGWRSLVDSVDIRVPAEPGPGATIRSNLAYILINQDKAAIQPGSRSYERSWIRDGSLTSAALLRLGHADDVQRFIDWFAPYQYADGKVPCCVDRRGADPVPENDSHGELVYLITEYFRFTSDTALVRRHWTRVERAIAYMDSLRLSRRTPEYRGTGFWGMLPQSISHEGYSAKPMHSYWDDFFALKGFRDAAWLAQQLGDTTHARQWQRIRDEFELDLSNSFRATMQKHGIDYLPGSVELGDFDATSTTVGLNPAGAQSLLPQAALARTFEKYWEQFVQRRDSTSRWEAYTPYEWRVVGSLVRLGQRERAHEVADWFMTHRRPANWNHWAEVVYRDSTAPHFIGDMPHTWVGSDFIRSMLDMFVYEQADTLIIGAGIAPKWLASATDTVAVSGIHTPYGEIAYRVARDARTANIRFIFDKAPRAPARGFVIRYGARDIRVSRLPREVLVRDRNE